ncbi:MAG: carboxypeptidase regulatory-like domain-containing protein [Gemmatimonadales bacterium]
MNPSFWILAIGALLAELDTRPQASVRGSVDLPRPAGTVIYLEYHDGNFRLDSSGTVMLDQRGLEFRPHVLVVSVGTAVEFRNSDPLMHNVFSPSVVDPFNLHTYPQYESRFHTFATEGMHIILCHAHPEMSAYVFAVPTDLFAVADSSGAFEVTNVPSGTYTLRATTPYGSSTELRVEVPEYARTVDVRIRFRRDR